jgi:hypothetical protein
VKRSGGLTYVRPGFRVTGRISDVVAYPLYPRSCGQTGPPPSPPPPRARGGEGGRHWLRQAPAPFLLWSSQTHPPTLGSRGSASPVGVCRVSHWFGTSGTPLTYFRLRSFPLRSRQPCIRGRPGSGRHSQPAPFTRRPRVCP